jgi:uncharacterized protein YjiS (DUF1127 family)
MDTISLGARHKARPARRLGPAAVLVLWWERVRSRRQLRLLLNDRHVLADLGLTREEADVESTTPFWR